VTKETEQWMELAQFHQDIFASRQTQEWRICLSVWGGIGSLTLAPVASGNGAWLSDLLPALPFYYFAALSGMAFALFWIHANHAVDRVKKYDYAERATPQAPVADDLVDEKRMGAATLRAKRESPFKQVQWFLLQVLATILIMIVSLHVLTAVAAAA
jgi:hypothetical protein